VRGAVNAVALGRVEHRQTDQVDRGQLVGALNLRFVAPATTSIVVDARMSGTEIERITSELEETGKAKWVLEQKLIDEQGMVVATSNATYFGRSF
jgi:hypothetical protein